MTKITSNALGLALAISFGVLLVSAVTTSSLLGAPPSMANKTGAGNMTKAANSTAGNMTKTTLSGQGTSAAPFAATSNPTGNMTKAANSTAGNMTK
ncbi:MAG: hypothetical protein WA395_13190, partial [Nitrososphaeraceae archaeon]